MDTPENRETPRRVNFGAGLHTAAGQRVDDSAYHQYIGRWSRFFVPNEMVCPNSQIVSSRSKANAMARLILLIASFGSLPSLRSSRTVGKEASPCTFATES